MAEKHFVVQGAACKCNFGSAPDKLKITANDRDYINDGDGSAKPIASSKDIGQPLEAKTFGSCSVTRSSCSPAITQWQGFYEKVTLTNGGKILTEDSKAICSVSGSPCVSILFHGQTAAVNSAHFDKVQVETMAALNPMAPKPANNKETPKVKSIKANAVVSAKVVPVLKARVDESVTFTVKDYYNAAKADKDKVSWKVFTGHGFDEEKLTFEEIGPELKMNFDAVGEYRVMAYGKEGNDASCSIDITVAKNRLKPEFSFCAGMGRITSKQEYRVRRGVPVTVEAKFEMSPATGEEKELVMMQVVDGGGNVVATGHDTVTFTPSNSAATYQVNASMEGQEISRDLISEANGVVAVKNDQNLEVIRPNTPMNFQVSELVYTTQVQDFEKGAIKWQLNGRDVGTGNSLRLDGTHFSSPGKYVVEAYVMKADAWDARKNAPSSADQKDDWRFEVKHNEVVKIEGATTWIVGKRYTLVAKTLMPYKQELDGPFTWNPAGSKTEKSPEVYAPHKGKFVMSATLGRSTKTLEATAAYAEITAWYFADKELVYKPKAGWKETLKVLINAPAAAGETVNIHILEDDKGGDYNYIKDLGNGTFDAEGVLKLDLNTDDIKPLLNKLYFEGKEYDVLFAILSKPGGVEFADMKTLECDGKKFLFPQKQSNVRGKEMGKYVYINSDKEVVSVHFYDSTGYPAYKVYKYGEKIKIHIQTRNLSTDELNVQIWENKYKAEDKMMLALKGKVADEVLDLELDTAKLKSGDPNAYRAFYVVVKTDKGFKFPKEVADANMVNPKDVNFYQHIKLSDNGDALNKKLKDVAPAVLGEALEKEEDSKGCPRCAEKITSAMLKTVFPDAEPAVLETVASIYNKYMKELNMDTCWNKAHFFAQASVESGTKLHMKDGENFNWYWEELPKKFGAFSTTEGLQKAQDWGRAVRKPAIPGVTAENQKNIANYAYSPDAAMGKILGNTQDGDGWNFRGKGLIQLTGRSAYEYANTYTKRENADIVTNPDLVLTDVKIAVLSSMAFWKWKKLQQLSNGQKDVNVISGKVGSKVASGDTDNYTEKAKAFKDKTSPLFKVSECTYGIVPQGDNNKYKIDADAFTYEQIRKNDASKQYQFDVYVGGKLEKTYLADINAKKLLPFPATGPNWGRFGTRDGGDDNYSDPKVAAAALGFFYSLPKNGYTGTLYFNDMSASDKRNLGHQGHIEGNDIDIRYPGSDAGGGEVLWSTAKNSYPSEEKFVEALENILTIAGKWGFKTNYAYKAGIKNTMGTALSVHQNHFHIGLR
jgi:predicted chitinase